MQLLHALRDLTARLWSAHLVRFKRLRLEELLKTAVGEGAKEAWADVLATKAAEDCELTVAIDKVGHLRTVNAKQELLWRTGAGGSAF